MFKRPRNLTHNSIFSDLKNKLNLNFKSLTGLLLASTLTLSQSAISASDEDQLIIWINGDKGYNGLQKVGDRFTKDTGIKVKVAHPDAVTDKFQQSAAAGGGPDIFIWAHDRFGEWARAGLISEVKPSENIKKDVADFAWEAVNYNGKLYGYPIAAEAIGLIYNKDLLPTPPKTVEEIFDLHKTLTKKGKKAILWDYNNTYFTWPLLSANGGYPFKKTDKGYDIKDTGVNNDGALAGANMLKKLIDDGVMPEGVDYGVMESAFNKGEVAMMINGPWAWANLKKSGINFGVAALPSINGKPSKAFTGVLAATLNAMSKKQDLAVEFLEQYLLNVDGLKTVNDDVPIGAATSISFMSELSSDPNIKATFQNAIHGEPMPNVPEMGKFWSAMEPALKNITSGRQSVSDALNAAAKRIVK